MMHLFLEKGPWFRAKSYGYGAGLPFTWQGWAMFTAHIGIIVGLGLLFEDRPMLLIPVLLLATVLPLPIYAARTEGGWRWRWGATAK